MTFLDVDVLKSILKNRKKSSFPLTQKIPRNKIRAELINENVLECQIQDSKERYEKVIKLTNEKTKSLGIRKRIPILAHGYAYPIPNGKPTVLRSVPGVSFPVKGPWLKKAMDPRHITKMAEKKAIVKILIDDYNAMLKSLTGPRSNFHHVDLRNALGNFDPTLWYDEIHLRTAGFKKIAAKYDSYIKANNLG